MDRQMILSFLGLVLSFSVWGFSGYYLAGDDWTLRGIFTFFGCSIGSVIWFIVMLIIGMITEKRDQ